MNLFFGFNGSFRDKGFSLVEVLITLSIIGILSGVAVVNYNSYKKTAEATEGKHLLARIYGAEKQFFENWKTYHSNLVIIGAFSAGMNFTHYNAGFTDIGTALSEHPASTLQASNCNTYKRICALLNLQQCNSLISSSSAPSCQPSDTEDSLSDIPSGKTSVNNTEFKAVAHGGSDRQCWSIDHNRLITPEAGC